MREAGLLPEASVARRADLLAGLRSVTATATMTVLDVLYPPHCMACRAATQGPRGLCASCWSGMRLIERPFCERLGVPFSQDLGPGLISPEAIARPPVFERARAVACYDDGPVRNLISNLKYGDRPDYGRVLGLWMARAGAELLQDAQVIVPVPLHRRRLWQRRYNQAAVLAHAIGRAAGKAVRVEALERRKSTRSQVGMTRNERALNIQGAFRLGPESPGVRGSRVLLVDDVLTTGATANAAARMLLRGGATGVDLLVFAQAVTTV